MKGPLLAVIAAGFGIGFVLPDGNSAPAPAEEPTTESAAIVRTAAAPAAPRRAGWGQETRLRAAGNGHFHTVAMVNGQPVELVVDTGASIVALTIADARRIGIAVDERAFEIVGSGASGPVRGQQIMLTSVSIDGKEVRTVRGAVLEGLDVSLLGQSYLSHIAEVKMSNGEMILR